MRDGAEPHPDEAAEAPPVEDRPGAGSLDRAEARRDVTVRRWDVVTPAATRIGRPENPEDDLPDSLRRLHDEQHTATEGHSRRTHYLDRLRITHAICNTLDLPPWQRDRVLGVMGGLDLTAFGSQRGVPKVALVVVRHVVDVEVRRQLGIDDAGVGDLDEDELASLHERYRDASITEDEDFRALCERHDLDVTSLNRLRRVLKNQLDDGLRGAAFGRDPNRDPHLPATGERVES